MQGWTEQTVAELLGGVMKDVVFRGVGMEMYRTGLRWMAVVVCLVMMTAGAFGQAVAGLSGTVTDASGATLPGVTVTILNRSTGVSQRLVTSSAGVYAVSGLLPGRYTVTAEIAGFKKEVRENVPIEIGAQATISIAMSTGNVDETVNVDASSITLNTVSAQLGTTIEPELINALPTEVSGRGRQIDSFQFLAPGVQGNSFAHQVSGGVYFQEEVVVNGIPLPQSETPGMTTIVNPPWELVREFRVERSTFSAQYGLGQGAVNYQTAGGTNTFHGDIFEINRNSSFDSKGFQNLRVPTDHENNYGFTIAGPVRIPKLYNGKDRTFFHVSAEWFKQNKQVTGFATVPTAQEKQGDFSDFVNPTTGQLIPIYDPQTGEQFSYQGRLNVINPARFSPISVSLLQYLPDPDRQGTGVGGLDGNKNFAQFANPTINHNWGFTIDHNLTSNQSLHWAEWRNSLTTNQFFATPFVVAPNPLSAELHEPQLGTGFLLSYANSITPHLVLTTGLGWLGEINNENPVVNYNLPSVENPLVFPQISFDGQHGPTQWGTSGSLAHSINRKLGISFVNNWLWTRGRHTFNFGGEIRRTYQDAYQDGSGGGAFYFSQRTTSTPNQGADFNSNGSSFASFLLGQVDHASRSFSQQVKLRNFDVSPYVMDDIKLTPRLTVNIGGRWDIMVPFTTVANNVAFLDASRPNTYAGGLPGAAVQMGTSGTNSSGYNRADTHFGHFGPRVGAAYMLNDKTVVQAGFSLAYLIGGAYDYGDNLVADNYTQLLGGTFQRSSTGGNTPAFGSWDTNQLPSPPPSPITDRSGVGSTIFQFDRNTGFAPYTQQWNVNVQRQLPYDTFLTLAYLGNREIHIVSHLNPLNQPNPSILGLGSQLKLSFADGSAQAAGFQLPYPNFVQDFGGSATVEQALSPLPQYANIVNEFEGAGTVFYNGFQAQAEKRYTNGLAFLTSLTLARTLSNTDGGNGVFAGTALNKFDQEKEYTVASSDQLYNVKVSGTYELPIGIRKQFLNHGIAARILGGIQVSGILDYEGGTPLSPSSNVPAFLNGGNRPDRVAGQPLSMYSYGRAKSYFTGKTATNPELFNTAGFAATPNYVLGNAYRNYSELRSAPTRNESLGGEKHFLIGDHVRGTVRVEFFNAFNRAILANPSVNVNDGNYGRISSASQANNNRQGQGTLRLEF